MDTDLCHRSKFQYAHSAYFKDRDLYYSYETCGGSSDAWEELASVSELSGATIRAAVPKLSRPNHSAEIDGEIQTDRLLNHSDTDHLEGIYIAFYEELADRAGFTIEWSTTSGGSLDAHDSDWTACVDDVHKGLLDLCIGNFWMLPERIAISSFTTPNTVDHFRLFVPRPKPWELEPFVKPFSPFTATFVDNDNFSSVLYERCESSVAIHL